MKQTVLGEEEGVFRKRLNKRIYLCVAVIAAVLVCNIVFVFLGNDNNYKIFMWCDIATDIVAGIFLVAYASAKISLPRKVLRMAGREKEEYCGVVQSVSEETLRYSDFDCFEVALSGRVLYLVDNGAITLAEGREYRFETTSKIITAAEEI